MNQAEKMAVVKRLQNQIRYMNRIRRDEVQWPKEASVFQGMTMILAAMDVYVSCDMKFSEGTCVSRTMVLFPGDTEPLKIFDNAMEG